MDLYALILHLHPTETTKMPAMLGEQAHAAFLALMRESNPDLAAWLHEDQGDVKPFGVALLVPWKALQQREWTVGPFDTLRLRVTLAGRPLYQQFMQHFLAGHYRLRLGHATFQTGRIVASGVGEPLAGHATTAQLWEAAVPRPQQKLRFVMPTTWKQGAGTRPHYALLPEARPIFQKLSQTWHEWAEPSFHFDYRSLLTSLGGDAIFPTAHHVRSIHWQARNPPMQGFVGWVRYEVGGPAEFQQLIDLLCSFSFFSGVGYGRGRGLGVTVPEPEESEDGD